MYIHLHVYYQLFSSDFNKTNFHHRFSNKKQNHTSSQSVQLEPSCTMQTKRQTDGRTYTMKLIVASGNFAYAPEYKYSFSGSKSSVEKCFVCVE